MSYRLSEAASLNKSTVRRAIKTGKVSATKGIRTYAAEIALLRDRIEDLKTLTDEFRVWVRDLTEQRDRAEARAAELDKRLLAYQPPAPTLPPPRRRWWRRSASTV